MTAPTVYPETIHATGVWYPTPVVVDHGERRDPDVFHPGNAVLAETCALCPEPIRVGQLYVNDRVPPVHLHCAQQATQ